jgi:hypothetical protein
MKSTPLLGRFSHRLTRGVGIHLDRHTLVQEGFGGNHAVQFGKHPFRLHRIAAALPGARVLALGAMDALTNVGQVLYTNQTVWVAFHNACADHMVAVLIQPSLSSTHLHQAAGRRTSAFLLQPFSRDLAEWFARGTMRVPG